MAAASVVSEPGIAQVLALARRQQAQWAATPLRERLRRIRHARVALAESSRDLLELFPPELNRTHVDTLTAELMPLADACRFLELEAERVLQPEVLSARARPLLQRGVTIEVRREPLGVVLVIGPANYPLFLPAVQTLQALAAGNAVVWKPGRGGKPVADAFALILGSAKMPRNLVTVVDDSVDTATEWLGAGVDKIVLTGSVESGRAVLEQAAEQITPAIVELSGCDALIVDATADLKRAASALAFGLRLNHGFTCIAPRRLLVHIAVAHEFESALAEAGARDLEMPAMLTYSSEDEAVALVNRNAHALGASVFASETRAKRLARRLQCGVVVVNDVIVPTADPRLPFGGRKLSGYGTTRGAEGLLQMTVPKAIATQRAKRLRHLEPVPEAAASLFLEYMATVHASSWRKRVQSLQRLAKVVFSMRKESV